MRNQRPRGVFSFALIGFVLLQFVIGAHAQTAPGPDRSTERQHVEQTADVLMSAYDAQTGLFHGTGWWNSANGITALANVTRDLQTKKYSTVFPNTFQAAQHKSPGFLNEFYDDEGWWALAWLDVYGVQHDPQYLRMSQSIFTDMAGGWSDTCGGGIWWKKNEHYKNAIANELFLSVAVRLAAVSDGAAKAGYLQWAQKEAHWFLGSGMINSDSLVNDGLDATCHNNQKETWTYNQGVLLTGLVGLHDLTGDASALQTANNIAAAVAKKLTDPNGVIHDGCEPNCGEDGIQFKGIYVRNLVELLRVAPSATSSALIEANAESVWAHARTPDTHFSVNWSGPPQDSGTGSLISALDALTAELSVHEARH